MQYIERIIQEELKKKVNEGFFDKFKFSEENPKQAKLDRINASLDNLRKSINSVCGNLTRYGQTVQNYLAVNNAMKIERWSNQFLAQIGNTLASMSQMDNEGLIPNDEPEEVGQGSDMPVPPQQQQVQQQSQEEPMPAQEQPEDDYRGFSPGDPTNAPEYDQQNQEEGYQKLAGEEESEYVRCPRMKVTRDNAPVVWFDGGSMEYEAGNSVYRIIPSEENPDVGQFELIDDDIVRQLVTTDIRGYLSPCCKGTPITGARRIVTRQRGQVEYRDEKWYVTKKAVIEFIK